MEASSGKGTVPSNQPEDKKAQGFSQSGIPEKDAQKWITPEGVKDTLGKGTNETGPVNVRK